MAKEDDLHRVPGEAKFSPAGFQRTYNMVSAPANDQDNPFSKAKPQPHCLAPMGFACVAHGARCSVQFSESCHAL